MSPTQPQIPQSIQQLAQLVQQMQQMAEYLPPFESILTQENIAFVHDGATDLAQKLHNMWQACITSVGPNGSAPNPLECKDLRHDLRNNVAVVRGFSDLMLMDVPTGHEVIPVLDHLRVLSDHFVSILDSVKNEVDAREAGAPMAAMG